MENTLNLGTNSNRMNPPSSPFVLGEAYWVNSFPEEDMATLIHAKQILYPPFFSEKGLAQDILELTHAEPDIPLNTFITLNSLMKNNKFLKDSWTVLLGTGSIKGILHPPEHLMGYQKEIQLLDKLPQQEEKVFKRFEDVFTNIDALKKNVIGMEDLKQKETILRLLNNVRAFYADYKAKVLNVCQTINQKKTDDKSIEKEDLSELSHLIEPKAILFGELLLQKGPAFRISRDTARHILSLDNDGSPLVQDSEIAANHRVSYLPYDETSETKANPRVYFKANGLPPLQPGKEAMLYSLYRLLNIPVPQTGLLILTGLSDHNPAFYTVQASEAIIGESIKSGIDLKEELKTETNYFLSFCQQVLGAILTNPGDGKPDNFIYHREKYGLVSVDNDEIFYNEFSAARHNKGYYVETKSFLFCIEAMYQPLPRSFSNFLITLDIELLLLAWLSELDQKNQEYMSLESALSYANARQNFQKILPHESSYSIEDLLKRRVIFYPFSENFLESLSLPITVSNNLLKSLQTKLSQIAKALADNLSSTPQDLLEKTSSNLAAYYKTLRNKYPDPLEAIKVVWEESRSSAGSFLLSSAFDISFLSSITTLKVQSLSDDHQLPVNLFLNLYQSFNKSRILDRFVEKYGERRKKRSLQPEEALRELWCLIRMGLTTFQSIQNIVDFWYKGRGEIKDNRIIQQWDVLFFLLQDPELKWLFTLEKYFPRGWKNAEGKSISDVKGAFIGKCSLSEAMMKQILDKSGTFKEEMSLPGRSKVARFPNENPIFYLKKSPEIPGYEYAATLFMRSLGLEGVPFSELLLFWGPSEGVYSVLLTQAVQGVTLDKIWHDDNNFSSLDPHHTHLLILCSILLNPEDGKGDNYVLTPDKRRIIPIDNDHMFLPGIIQEERGFFSKTIYTELQSKTVLYCLHEMNKPIPSSVTRVFIDLDIDKFLDSWLVKLTLANENYQNLPAEDHLRKAGEKGVFFRIALQIEYIKNLYTKFYRMKQFLSEHSQITPFEILSYLEPYVGKLYKKVFQEESTVFKRFMKLTENLYQTDKNGHQISRLNSIQVFKILNIPKSELIKKNFLCKLNPHNALEFLAECREKLKEKESFYQRVIKGEAELEKTDLSRCSEDQEKIIFGLAFEKNREALALHNSKLLDGRIFSGIFDSLPTLNIGAELKLLDLRGAQKLNSLFILLISAYLPNIEYLNLGSHPNLKCAMFLGMHFKRMKRLVISNCHSLSGLLIESSLLDVLELKSNPNLRQILLCSPNLTYFDFTASDASQIHILRDMERLQLVKPDFNRMEEITHKVETITTIRNEVDPIIDRIVKEVAVEENPISAKTLESMKSEMPDQIWRLFFLGFQDYLESCASADLVSFLAEDSVEKRRKRLENKVKIMIENMLKETFNSQKIGK